MVVEVGETLEKTKHVKNKDKSKNINIVRGGKNVRYYDRILSERLINFQIVYR